MASEHASYWSEAIEKELAGLIGSKTWTMVNVSDLPTSANIMHSHFVFTVKRNRDGSVDKFKARLVANGNTQQHGVDFDRIFSTVVRFSTIRILLVIAAAEDYNLTQVDVRQAYLQASLTEDLYMRPPPGVRAFKDGQQQVCKLLRSLYGLKQAGREWAVLLASFLIDWGLTRSTIDVCLYTYEKGKLLMYVAVYVDDLLICDNDSATRDRFVSDLNARFPTEDRGELRWLLGVGVTRDRSARTLSLSQELHVDDMIKRHASFAHAGHSRKYDMPMEEGLILEASDCPTIDSPEHAALAAQRTEYMAVIGGLLWLSNVTRPDISYAAGQLARFLSNPGERHIAAAARVLIYLDTTRTRALVLAPNAGGGAHRRPLEAYVDSSWAVKFSCSGGLLFFMGCLVHWFSRMQRSVALSSAEAEFFGAMMCAREVVCLRELVVDLGMGPETATTIFSDSRSAVALAFDPVAFKNTKHILRAAEFLRDLVARRVVALHHVKGTTMIADILTKAVSRPIFISLLRLLDDYSSSGLVVV